MIKIDEDRPFNASWNQSNVHLNHEHGSLLDKIAKKVKNFVFYLPNSFVAVCVNPRSESSFFPLYSLETDYRQFEQKIITPDGIHLAAKITLTNEFTADTPTVIMFNPLASEDSLHHNLKADLINRKCNVVTFNYRGLGTTWRAQDFVVDGDSVYQFVIKKLGIQSHQVHFYGFSFGGAIAAQVKALHPESTGKYVGDRPFRSLFSLITENCCIERLGGLIKKITSFISSLFLAYPVYLLGWEWDGDKALSKLKGDRRIIYHPNDYLIPFAASLGFKCPLQQLIRLNPKETGLSTHFATIGNHKTDNNESASALVVDFLAS